MPATTCPYCKVYARFTLQSSWAVPELLLYNDAIDNGPFYGAFSCGHCNRGVVGVVDAFGNFSEYVPQSTGNPPNYLAVPQPISEDAQEAHTCLAIGATRASVLMARRVIEAMSDDQGAPTGKLAKRIEWLGAQGLIIQRHVKLAHTIRYLGNEGAHDKTKPTQTDAEALLGLMDALLRAVYDETAIADQLMDSQRERKAEDERLRLLPGANGKDMDPS